ncbi:ATP-binding protein [Arthrospiribacter ruber]|uniref:AAA family ATPase n=1 Tax=Arthrospiribacter ruber TaxID=2487934 RepID=A0A951M9E9_9BACT|nr:ATP-binding protein [Arthrospiribacter ruber]MBW3467501.1 AAA family ATPase [Arthrospiribacter ruber]
MFNNIIFIGGIHGSGKGSMCSNLRKNLNIEHMTASDILNWSDISPEVGNKLVTDISFTQDRLIDGLKKRILPDKIYLLDGHFCLFDSNGCVENIPMDTFTKIDPIIISVVVSDPKLIVKRLSNRDKRNYDLKLIDNMQKREIEYGKEVANKLNIPFVLVERDLSPLLQSINQA